MAPRLAEGVFFLIQLTDLKMLHQRDLGSGINRAAVNVWIKAMSEAGRLEAMTLAPEAEIYIFDRNEIVIIERQSGPDQRETRTMIYGKEVDASLRLGGAFNFKER